ncbi:RHS repeat-associated core domain-containing protein [Sneathiella marina]|uniref:RHS repeat-associated core domain-containing protein n=1 Tax=Sneathiella marina TaxID=2950108 RepID=A0ABY4VXX2_9PROT|nr:RHS repeat-associated core domain-containing protein [Sneathiella marina]USG59765.1 RHS repeat-associated core domain-containing protein [Sneathiella marina]
MNKDKLVVSKPAGSFFISKYDGSSNYILEIEAVPGVREMQPAFSLSYSSGKTEVASYIGPGWQIEGIPQALSDGSGNYFVEDHLIIAEKTSLWGLRSFDHEGNKTDFEKSTNIVSEREVYVAIQSEDAYGNCIKYEYDDSNRPVNISYGTAKNQFASIEFTYADGVSGCLSEIITKRNDIPVRKYTLMHEKGTVRFIQTSATDAKNPSDIISKNPVEFIWGNTTATKNMLTELIETTGLRFKTTYQSKSGTLGIVDTSTIIVNGLSGKQSIYERIVNASGFMVSRNGTRYARDVVIWDRAEGSGEYYRYNLTKQRIAVLIEEGMICKAQAQGRGEQETALAVYGAEPSKTTYHYLSGKTTYEYIDHIIGVPLLFRTTAKSFFEGALMSTVVTLNKYDEEGNIKEVQTPETTAVYTVQKGPVIGNLHLRLPKRTALFDTSNGDMVTENSPLLKDDTYTYNFDTKGKIKAISHQTLVEGTTYSNKKISELGDYGLPKRHVGRNGLTIEHSYSDDFSRFKSVFTSADGKQTQTESLETDLRYGLPVRAVTAEGNVTAQAYDAFGERIAQYGFDPSAPQDWSKPDQEKLVCLAKTETGFDKVLKLFCIKSIRAGNAPGVSYESRCYVDDMFRPVIEAMQLDRKTWQLICHGYSSCAVRNMTSTPLELKASPENLSVRIQGLKKSRILWLETCFDDFGRVFEEKRPDGTLVRTAWERQEKDQIEVTTTTLAKNGELLSLSSELENPKGVVETHNQSDSKPTRYSYDVLGRITEKIDPLGQSCTYKWNAQDICIEENNPVTGTSTCMSDPTLLISREVKNGEVFDTDFDWLGRPTATTHTGLDGKKKTYGIAYIADAQNRSTGYVLSHPDGWRTALRFAPTGQEIERTLTLGEDYIETVRSSLTPDGFVSRRHFPCGRSLQFDHDAMGITRRISWAGTDKPIAHFDGHDSHGRPIVTRYGNGVTEYRNYDKFGNIANFTVANTARKNTKPYLSLGYATNGSLNTAKLARSARMEGDMISRQAFNYDHRGKLVSDLAPADAGLREYKFGPSENLQSVAVNNNITAFETNKTGYQVTKVTGDDPLEATFDRNGNIRTLATESRRVDLLFDAFGNLAQSSGTGDDKTSTVAYVTDIAGHRFIKASPDGTVHIEVSPDYTVTRKPDGMVLRTVKAIGVFGVFAEFTLAEDKTADKPLFKSFETSAVSPPASIPEPLQAQGIHTAGDVYIHLDDLGSSLLATDEKGAKTAAVMFDTYGAIDAENTTGSFNFTVTFAGMKLDIETGLYFAGARYYSTELRRFISPDPQDASTDPYAYPSDPVNFFDDNGACNQHCTQIKTRFQDNMGRKMRGLVAAFSIILISLVTIPIAMTYYKPQFAGDTSLSYALRWAGTIILWFGFLPGIPALFNTLNKKKRPCLKRICCADICQGTEYPLNACGMSCLRIVSGTFIGASNMAIMILSVTNTWKKQDNGWQNLVLRGTVGGFGAEIIALVFALLFGSSSLCTSSITMRQVSNALVIFIGMNAFHVFDGFVVVYYLKELSWTELFTIKLEFILMELAMVPLMAKPNVIWALLPALSGSNGKDCWSLCFKPKREANIKTGAALPLCCWRRPDCLTAPTGNNGDNDPSRGGYEDADLHLPNRAVATSAGGNDNKEEEVDLVVGGPTQALQVADRNIVVELTDLEGGPNAAPDQPGIEDSDGDDAVGNIPVASPAPSGTQYAPLRGNKKEDTDDEDGASGEEDTDKTV